MALASCLPKEWQDSPLQASEGFISLGAGTLLVHVEKEAVLKPRAWPELP